LPITFPHFVLGISAHNELADVEFSKLPTSIEPSDEEPGVKRKESKNIGFLSLLSSLLTPDSLTPYPFLFTSHFFRY
jgi:hypothetical protein